MAVVQGSYTERVPKGVAGQVWDTHTYDADTYVCGTTLGIPFGVAVKLHATDPNVAELGTGAGVGASFVASNYIGVTVKDPTRSPTSINPTDAKYEDGAHMAVCTRGDILVKVESAVSAGDDVTVDTATGVLSTATAAADQGLIPNARFMSDAGAGELAVVRLPGTII